MKKIRTIVVILCLLFGLYKAHEYVAGYYLQPVLKNALVDAFDMPFEIEGLRVCVFPLRVSVDRLACLNPAGFRRREHWVGTGITLDIDPAGLKKKCIQITRAHFRKALFAVESYMTPQGSRTNTWIWYHHMGLDEDDPPDMNFPSKKEYRPEEAAEEAAARGKWRTKIRRLTLDSGTIIYDDRTVAGAERYWVFNNLKGHWDGFDFISGYISPVFTEYIKLEGTFGQNPPARFRGEGKCQFADGDNFDVDAEITDGSIAEYDFLLEGLPGEAKGGTFDLRSHLLCHESDLKSEHRLTLRNMKLATPTATQKLLKYPFGAVLMMLQTQKTIELEVRVNGYIGDPKFHFFSAFTKAFQKSLTEKARMVIDGLAKAPVKIASAVTPNPIKNGFGALTDVLVTPFKELKSAGQELEEGAQTIREDASESL